MNHGYGICVHQSLQEDARGLCQALAFSDRRQRPWNKLQFCHAQEVVHLPFRRKEVHIYALRILIRQTRMTRCRNGWRFPRLLCTPSISSTAPNSLVHSGTGGGSTGGATDGDSVGSQFILGWLGRLWRSSLLWGGALQMRTHWHWMALVRLHASTKSAILSNSHNYKGPAWSGGQCFVP